MSEGRFSVVIPTFNRASHVAYCLAPFLDGAARGLEVIVVDDGSTDATEAEVEAAALRSRGADIRYVRQANAGPGAARNLGAGMARSEWIVFHDIDDRWFPWTIAALREALENTEGCALLFVRAATFAEDAELSGMTAGPVRMERDADFASFAARRPIGIYGSCNVAAPRALLMEVGGFEESIRCGEDIDLFYRLSGRGAVASVTAPAMMAYRVNSEGSLSASPVHMRGGHDFLIRGVRSGRYAVPAARISADLARQRKVLAQTYLAHGRLGDAWGLLLPEAQLMMREMGAISFLKTCLTPVLSLVRPQNYRFDWTAFWQRRAQ